MSSEQEEPLLQFPPFPPKNYYKIRHKKTQRYVAGFADRNHSSDVKFHNEHVMLGTIGREYRTRPSMFRFLAQLASRIAGKRFDDYRKHQDEIFETIRKDYEIVEFEVREKTVYG
jgi:hypothetical protein